MIKGFSLSLSLSCFFHLPVFAQKVLLLLWEEKKEKERKKQTKAVLPVFLSSFFPPFFATYFSLSLSLFSLSRSFYIS